MAEAGAASRRFGCPSCGGGLRYDIASRKMKCDRCDTLTEMEKLPQEPPQETMEVTEYHCPQCGAAVYSTDTEITSFCSFCGSDVILTGKMGRTKRPTSIVPFRVSREDCEAAYRTHLKKYLLAPGTMKTTETMSHFRPVYVPFWSYQVEAEGPARLTGKKSYTRGNTRYDETYDLTMDAEIRQKGILYDASTVFEDETAAMLRHTMEEAVPFHPAYLSGFYAQGADVPAETYYPEAAASAVRIFMEQVRKDNEMDSVEMKGAVSQNFGLPNARYQEELVMMPVWLLAHRQGERVVYTAINGQNGEVVCDVPVSNGKTAGLAVGLAAVLFLLLQVFLTLRPELLLAFCAIISLLTQYQFSGAQKRLYNRRTRAGEPDFEKQGKAFTGPAQSLLNRKKSGITTRRGGASELSGRMKGFPFMSVIILVIFGFSYLNVDYSSASELMSHIGWKTPAIIIMGVVLLVMLIHTLRRMGKPESGPPWLRIISCAACGAGLISLLAGQVEDLIYYGCAAAVLIASAAELVIINRAHNEYASRPVPFFRGEEEAV